MTFEIAITLLQHAGLRVSSGSDALVAVFDLQEPHPLVQRQGVTAVARFAFSLRKIGAIWFLREGKPPNPSEEFESLGDAIARSLELFETYKRSKA